MTSRTLGWFVLIAAASLCSCGMRSQGGDMIKVQPASNLQYQLKVDSASLPEGVTARERQVPGTNQVQTWLRNVSNVPFIILTTNFEGRVVRRQKIVGNKVFIGSSSNHEEEPKWQRLEGVEEVLVSLNVTPPRIVAGRMPTAGTDVEVPAPEPFSIMALYGGSPAAIRGHIVYSATANEIR